jgi:hypothetical protein
VSTVAGETIGQKHNTIGWNYPRLEKEYRWVLVVSILILAFGSLPIIAGYFAQTLDQRFIGTFFDRSDYAVHLAMMNYGEQGAWGYQFRFTTEPHSIAYVKIFYIILGHLGGWIHLPANVLFQAARLLFSLLACLSIYRLLRRVFPSQDQRRLAFLLAMLGAGVGWFQVLFGLISAENFPVDLWFIDAYPLFCFDLFPHFSAVIAAVAIAITAFLDHTRQPQWQNIAIIVTCAVFVQIVNPIAFILADISMAGVFCFSCWQNRRLNFRLALSLGIIAVFQIPLLVYAFILLTRDPIWALFTSQNVTLSPSPIFYLLGFGLFWPFVIAGIIKAIQEREPGIGWAIFWTISAFGLAYSPFNSQRRFLLVATVPLAVLATPAILDLSRWLSVRLRLKKYSGAVIITTLMSLSTLMLVGTYSLTMRSKPSALFEPAALVQAVDWLGKNGSSEEVVLASEPSSQLVAMRTPLRLYFGHVMETLHYDEKSLEVQAFFQGELAGEWLEAHGITWVIYGPHEAIWSEIPPEAPNLEIAYQNEQVIIYRITHP